MNRKWTLPLISLFALTSCGGSTTSSINSEPSSSSEGKTPIVVEEREVQYIDDFYRNYYQIFPITYADSNGDKKGDLRGIIDKFDYIKSLNVTGLWLTPINSSPSYHKYDVTDYKSIDSVFGTLQDYDDLVSIAHQNHVDIILDLVLNHSSYDHPWFRSCMQAHINNDTSNKYYNYYVVEYCKNEGGATIPDGYARYSNSNYIYECRFWDRMPDFNLQGVIDGTNTSLINDFKDIMRFWLIDHNIDGFRLDACTSFFTTDIEKNFEFLTWVKTEAEKIKKDTYIIGEVLSGGAVYSRYYEHTNVDSYFAFDDSANYRNTVFAPILEQDATGIDYFVNHDINLAEGAVPAPTLANHDIGRSFKSDFDQNRLVHAIFSMGNGATFEYYGEEIGMANYTFKADENRPADLGFRFPVLWGDKYTCSVPEGYSGYDKDVVYRHGSVTAQDNDHNSMLNYFRKCYRYRLENPELARGSSEIVYSVEDDSAALIKRSYNGSDVYVAANLSTTEEHTIDLSSYNLKVVGDLSVGETPSFLGKSLVLPPQSIVLLH